jgi:hypothetical protein
LICVDELAVAVSPDTAPGGVVSGGGGVELEYDEPFWQLTSRRSPSRQRRPRRDLACGFMRFSTPPRQSYHIPSAFRRKLDARFSARAQFRTKGEIHETLKWGKLIRETGIHAD